MFSSESSSFFLTTTWNYTIFVNFDYLHYKVTWWCAHACRTVSYCFAMRHFRSIRYLVSASVFQSLVTALVLCRLDYGNSTLVGLPVFLRRRLQSVQNAAARLIFRLRRSDHITDALVSLHCMVTCAGAHNIQGCRPDVTCMLWPATYHSMRQFVRVADVPSRHRLRSFTSDNLIVPAVRLTSIGSRAFPVAGARIWNTLPLHVISASSLTAFKLHLKLHLFCFSFPGLSPLWLLSGPCSVCCHLYRPL